MEFSVECSCGQTIAVQATQAGTTTPCRCGKEVKVPSLSQLRERAGHNPYEASTIDVIHRMLRRGELPTGGHCAVSGDRTEDVVDLYVEADRTYRARDNRIYVWLGLLVSPILLFGLFQKPRPDVGRETIVPTPLRVAAAYHPRVRARLLDECPRASVRIKTSA